MRITPLDIRKQPFRHVWRGFDPDAVNSFLEMVASEYEAIIKQNGEYATQIKNMEARLESYTKIERVLNETLLTAQKATDEARVNAQKEAELILKDANLRAERYEDEARSRVHELESELVALRNQRDSFLARFKSMLTTQLNLLEIISGDLKQSNEGSRDSLMEIAEEETMDEVPPQPNISSLDA
ncbi:MAG TPA: DivIVA domain-containing protein [Chitinispirillaceae bacterium]|jgi:cell division initiation protein|nr:DivIVA domain-containing protein [Chitinispirillaceae bacterium]